MTEKAVDNVAMLDSEPRPCTRDVNATSFLGSKNRLVPKKLQVAHLELNKYFLIDSLNL